MYKLDDWVILGHSDIRALVISKCPKVMLGFMKAQYKIRWKAKYPGRDEDTYLIWVPKQPDSESYIDIEEGVTFLEDAIHEAVNPKISGEYSIQSK